MSHGSLRAGRARLAQVLAMALVLLPIAALAQVFVYPRRPNKSQVRYYDFEWRHVDILVGPEADTTRADEMKRRPTPSPRRPPDHPAPRESPHVPPAGGKPGDAPSGSTPPGPGTPAPGTLQNKLTAQSDSGSGPAVAPPGAPSPDDAPF